MTAPRTLTPEEIAALEAQGNKISRMNEHWQFVGPDQFFDLKAVHGLFKQDDGTKFWISVHLCGSVVNLISESREARDMTFSNLVASKEALSTAMRETSDRAHKNMEHMVAAMDKHIVEDHGAQPEAPSPAAAA